LILYGERSGIRTRDLWLRRPTLYPSELIARIEVGHAGIIAARYALEVVVKYPDPPVLKLHLDETSATWERGVPFLHHFPDPPLGVSLVIDVIAKLEICGASIHRSISSAKAWF
jgi:hypothetical protein